MTSPRADASRYVTPVTLNTTQLNRLKMLSVGVDLCGVVVWNAIRVEKSTQRQLVPCNPTEWSRYLPLFEPSRNVTTRHAEHDPNNGSVQKAIRLVLVC